ncbi:hypothetical protein [Pseudomonas sp. MPB23]|uniref:hypothetical protein n=1 Tax=Pseudomonas sp. MPB23 TaxID=3388490 RepID=UPI0039848839
MTKSEFLVYLDTEISASQARISTKNTKSDRVDTGRVEFLTVIKNMLTKNATPEDVGRLGAFNDVAQKLGVLTSSETLLSGLEG